MNENIETQKICPSCNNVNRGSNNYCRICGENLDGIGATKLETAPVSDISETNKVEIIKDYKASKYSNICCVILIPFVLIGFMILGLQIHPVVFGAFLIIFIFSIPIVICGFIQVLRKKSSYGQTRECSISDQGIKILIPGKFTFQIKWSQFDSVQVFQTTGSDYGILIYSSCSDYYHFHFFLKNNQVSNFILETDVDFSKTDVKRINSLIEQYARRLNKDYRWGKAGVKKKIKEGYNIPSQSIPAIQTIPASSNQSLMSQSQQIDTSIVCPYCGNIDAKQMALSWGKLIGGSICALIILWIIIYTFVPSGLTFISLIVISSICIIMSIISAIKRLNSFPVICPQCKKEYIVKRKKQNL